MEFRPPNSSSTSDRKPVPGSQASTILPQAGTPMATESIELLRPVQRAQGDQESRFKPEANQPMSTTQEVKYEPSFYGQPDLPLPPKAVAHHRIHLLWWALRYAIVFVVIFVALLIPILVFAKDAVADDDKTIEAIKETQYRNLGFYVCLWLLVTWVFAVFFDVFGLVLPYLFRFIARYVNSSHQRYWRIFKFMRRPICFLGTTIVCFILFSAFINTNPLLAVNIDKDPNSPYMSWDDIIDDILQQLTLWVAFYFVEKMLISYLAVHYHYRRSNVALTRTKDVHNALVVLYEASLYLHPQHSGPFAQEDMIIRNAKGDLQASARVRVSSYLARLGIDGYKVMSLFGNFISDSPEAHWLRPGSAYATIDRAWANPKAAAALSTRIWTSLVASGSHGLTENDIIEVLGTDRAAEAKAIFKTLDENDTNDIHLEDFVAIVTEAGKMRHNVYRTIADMDHCINTFDWLCLVIIAAVMVFFIVVQYVPAIKQIQTVLSSLAIGLSFAVGRTFNHLLTGIIFVFFDHPFDAGDVVKISAQGSNGGTAFVVKRQSLLYTIFRRLDNGSDLQISNDQLFHKSIENFSRSGINRQDLSIFVDFRTSFKDIAKLRTILDGFLRENGRDYVPGTLGLNVKSLHELNKMELRLAFTHRNNWSDDKLRAQRSNKFHCALVAACRAIPLYRPGTMLPVAGENGNPVYTMHINNTDDLGHNIQKERERRQGLRWDTKEEAEAAIQAANESLVGERAITANASKMTEEEAYTKLSQVAAPAGQRAAVSTGVDTDGCATGLRLTSTMRGGDQ